MTAALRKATQKNILSPVLQLLERISFLLRSAEHQSACTPLLAILQAYARAGLDTARAVWQCRGMQQGLIKVLNSAYEQGSYNAAAAAAMAVVRQLASVSPDMMQAITASGQPVLLHRGYFMWSYVTPTLHPKARLAVDSL